MATAEAGQCFEEAVAVEPGFARAHLCLGAIKFFEYQNGISIQPDLPQDYLDTLKDWKPGSPPPPPPNIRPLDPAAKRARIAEQNSTKGAEAEKHLKRALELEPHSEPAMEYLAALYFRWLEPANQRPERRDEARQWYAHLLETNPQHRLANYVLGVIDYEKASAIIRSARGFPHPLTDKNDRQSLRAQAGPLLAESARNVLRSLEIDPNSGNAMTYLILIRSDQAYIAETKEDAALAKAEADWWRHKLDEIMAARARAAGQPWPPYSQSAAITFTRTPNAGKPAIPSFPPDPQCLISLAPPPPPPSPSRIRP